MSRMGPRCSLAAAVLVCSQLQSRLVSAKPNFIFFQPDEMRAESLGCYGHPTSQTPNFDKFASEATRFDQAHVSYSVCTQSRVSFITGWPTHVQGHRTLWSLLHSWEPNLLKYFKSNNYTVKWWGKNDMLARDSWSASVTTALSMPGSNSGLNRFQQGEPGYYSFLNRPYPGPANETKDHNNVAAAINFLRSRSKTEAPFFIFLPLTLPHPPYSCPEPFYSAINRDTLPPLRPKGTGKPDFHALIRKYRGLDSLDGSFFRELHAVYLGAISYSDFLFGLLMAAVDEYGYRDTTTVSVFSDHGDYAGDYGGLVEKWPSGLEDVLTRVPLLIRSPGGAKGHVVREPVQVFDIVPTMLDIAGIKATHTHFGKSLVSQLKGADGDPNRAVFAEGGYSTNEPRDFEGGASHGGLGPKSDVYYPKSLQQQEEPMSVCRAVSVRTMSHKLVLRTDPEAPEHFSELYDLVSDPLELHNVHSNASYASVIQDLRGKIFTWYLHTSDVTPWREDPRSGDYPWPGTSAPQKMVGPIDLGRDTPTEPDSGVVWQ